MAHTAANDDLIVAEFKGDCAAIEVAIAAGADVNAVVATPQEHASSTATPLVAAVRSGRVDAVALLLGKGARVDGPPGPDGTEGTSALLALDWHRDVWDWPARLAILRLLLAAGPDLEARERRDDRTALHKAAAAGCLHAVTALLAAGASASADSLPRGVVGHCGDLDNRDRPLHDAAAACDEMDCGLFVLLAGTSDAVQGQTDAKNCVGGNASVTWRQQLATKLQQCAAEMRPDPVGCMRALLAAGADVAGSRRGYGGSGGTALDTAADSVCPQHAAEAFRLLAAAGAEFDGHTTSRASRWRRTRPRRRRRRPRPRRKRLSVRSAT
jgi:hypothetical protein